MILAGDVLAPRCVTPRSRTGLGRHRCAAVEPRRSLHHRGRCRPVPRTSPSPGYDRRGVIFAGASSRARDRRGQCRLVRHRADRRGMRRLGARQQPHPVIDRARPPISAHQDRRRRDRQRDPRVHHRRSPPRCLATRRRARLGAISYGFSVYLDGRAAPPRRSERSPCSWSAVRRRTPRALRLPESLGLRDIAAGALMAVGVALAPQGTPRASASPRTA